MDNKPQATLTTTDYDAYDVWLFVSCGLYLLQAGLISYSVFNLLQADQGIDDILIIINALVFVLACVVVGQAIKLFNSQQFERAMKRLKIGRLIAFLCIIVTLIAMRLILTLLMYTQFNLASILVLLFILIPLVPSIIVIVVYYKLRKKSVARLA